MVRASTPNENQSMEMLLQEHLPVAAPLQFRMRKRPLCYPHAASSATPWPAPVDTPMPMVHYLANGRYGLLITNAAALQLLARPRTHTLARRYYTGQLGCWLTVQDLERGALWSATRQPLAGAPITKRYSSSAYGQFSSSRARHFAPYRDQCSA